MLHVGFEKSEKHNLGEVKGIFYNNQKNLKVKSQEKINPVLAIRIDQLSY